MSRRFVLILSVFWLLIAAMLVAACIAARWRSDWLEWSRTDVVANTWRGVDVVNGPSGISVMWDRYDFQAPGKALVYAKDYRRVSGFSHETLGPQSNAYPVVGAVFNHMGFYYLLGDVNEGDYGPYRWRHNELHVPYWAPLTGLVFLGAGLPSVRAFVARRRRVRRLARGCCPSCGYDLRATPGRCPECGAATARSAVAA